MRAFVLVYALVVVPTISLAFSFSSFWEDSSEASEANPAGEEGNAKTSVDVNGSGVALIQPLLKATDWFLTEQEISDSRGGSPRSDLSIYTTGNAVTLLTVTNEFFNAVYDDFTATKEGDRVLIAAWEVSLITLKPDIDPTGVKTGFREVIAGVVERGASVNILGWSNIVHRTLNIKARDAVNKIPKSPVNGARALYIFDDRVRTFTSSHHQKAMVIAANSSSASKDQPIAYVGGLEITNDRWDTIYHNNSAFRDATNITFVRKGWIDGHLRIHGPAAKDVANNFLARWNSNYTPGDGLEDKLLDFENPEYEDLPMLDYASSRTTASLGSHSVQIVRTFSCEYDHYKEFAPHGETSLFQARIKAIKNAKNYIYVEDQYFILVPELLDALLAVMPTIQRLVIVTNAQDNGFQATGYAKYFYNMVSPLLEKYPDKIKLYTTKRDLKVFVHSKLAIIDDVYLSVGSANWNRRSMTSDSELSASVVDRDTMEAPDGITVNKLARDFRIRKFVEMTGLRYDELDAMTFLEAADQMGKAAVDESTILQVLEPKKHVYFPIFTNFVREQIDPQDTCTTEGCNMGKWLTIEEKYELIKKHRRSPSLSQAKLAKWAATAFNLPCPPSANTVKYILQSADSIEEKQRQGITKRGRDVVCPDLERSLKQFVDNCEANETRLSRKLLVQQAHQILEEMPEDTRPKMTLSVGWMTNFMARNGLRFRQFRRRRGEDESEKDEAEPGQPQRVVTDVTDHLALARAIPARQVEEEEDTVDPSTPVIEALNTEKTVMITGANRGIGLAFVKHYVEQGWNVIATLRDLDKEGNEHLIALNPWKMVPLDVSVEESIQVAARALEGVSIDLLINNAGMAGLYGLYDTTVEDCMRQFQVNALGPLLVTRALVPNLRLAVAARGSAFVAQVTSRIGSISDNSSGGAYAHRASKGALNVFTKSLAIDLEPQNIGCLLLHPGNVNTAYSNFTGAVEPEESVEGMTRLIARAKIGDPLRLLHFGKGDIIDW
ncbi:hypothetical protein G195_002889 [Phytophthora kernoviae 00238/432]|uniref:Phospholipase D n=1 Tax=Phytophthora kernoviae 00238/432 TaxID=1284355 RepID=A0A8J4SR69_9STRA|nr:hypothetical protein G195_002889 [Phytophthora kernoviae 00238/432]